MAENLSAFLKQNVDVVNETEYVASKRIKVNGEPVAWKIKTLATDETEKMRKKYTKRITDRISRQSEERFDATAYNEDVLSKAITYPNLYDAELQDSWGVTEPVELVKAMLTPGEYADLLAAVTEAQGYDVGMEDKVKEVKKLLESNETETMFAYLAFVKYHMRPSVFADMDMNEKAVVIAFIQQHAKDEQDEMNKAKRG